jgi:two-component system response regulator YesN
MPKVPINLSIGFKSYVSTSQCFLKNDITINSIAHELGVNRTALSNAINSTGSNFSTYLNQYRVSFAIKKLSSGEAKTIEDVAIDSGFNNDRTMRNAFKAITGLSPSYFFKSN